MSRPGFLAVAGLVLAAFTSGCGPILKDSGFSDVGQAVRERTGLEPHWEAEGDAASASAVADRVGSLLEDDLTADTAVEVALLNNRRLQASFEELQITRAELVESALPRNPTISAEVRFPADPLAPFEIDVVQSLLDLLQFRMRRDLARAAFEPAKLRAADDVLDLAGEVRAAFYTAQAAEQVVALRHQIVQAARSSAELAIRQRDAGNISDLDLENEQALYEQSKLELAESENELLETRERLNVLLGLWGEQTDWRIAPVLADPPAAEPDLERLESRAVSQRLEVLAAEREIEVAARAKPIARALAVGDITVSLHHEREPEGKSTTGPAIDVPLPLFNRGGAAKKRAVAMLRQKQQLHSALAVEVRSEVRSARSRVLAARSKVAYYRDVILPRRERIVGYSQRYYNFMLLGPYQLLSARQDEIAARREYIDAVKEYWIARNDLERAVGARLESPEPSSSEQAQHGPQREGGPQP